LSQTRDDAAPQLTQSRRDDLYKRLAAQTKKSALLPPPSKAERKQR
jgi:hypothetical protein